MKVLLISMPDIIPVLIHETALHLPNLGIASVAGNIDSEHEVYTIDLIRKRNSIKKYLTKILKKINPDIVGLSAMAWQYDTCVKIIKLIKSVIPETAIAIGGYHTTLMHKEISESPEAKYIDYMVRGEGEISFKRLINALAGNDNLEEIPSLSYKKNGSFMHNERMHNLDLTDIKLPIRDKRRLTWGYHAVAVKIEVIETSRGCTRGCNFCSMAHMYGRTFRTYPVERVLADIDDIYYNKKTRWIFIVDDNMVLNPKNVIKLCDAIIEKNYKNLNLVVQVDCVSMAKNEEMVKKMAQAGFKIVFLGIENVSKANLSVMNKSEVSNEAVQAVDQCHKYGIMVIAGLIFGLPDDNEESIKENYEFLKTLDADATYCQIITPYPKTEMREQLLKDNLVTNTSDYRWYNGLWANVKTKNLTSDQLQFFFWYHRQVTLGWWDPSEYARKQGWWTNLWKFAVKPIMIIFWKRSVKKLGWQGLFQRDIDHLRNINNFKDLKEFE